MLDIKLIRDDPKAVEDNISRRGDKSHLKRLAEVISLDSEWRTLKRNMDGLRQKRNQLSSNVDEVRKAGGDFKSIVAEARDVGEEIKRHESECDAIRSRIDDSLMRLPNILHDSVPVGESEEDNVVVRTWGDASKPGFELKHHGDIAVELGLADFDRAVKISGAGFYFLKGDLALMDYALMMMGIEMLVGKGYTLVEPPLMMRRKPYEGVTDLADFENVMYKINEEDEYLIATSEHPMAAMYMNEILEESDLPLKYCGISPCFRREIGKHSIDERGLFRVHQFNKIEQFVFSKPEDGWSLHEELVSNAEELLKAVGIPYRVVNVCTGDIGTVAAKKYDIEGWSPREGKYIELMSCSNCTSYQAARLGIRYRHGQEKNPVHTLNATMVATSRALRLILENYQTADGKVRVPEALQKRMGGRKEMG
ncbi:MAG: serine--tRNA ligase [Candidatus Altiarchaeota archaeon]